MKLTALARRMHKQRMCERARVCPKNTHARERTHARPLRRSHCSPRRQTRCTPSAAAPSVHQQKRTQPRARKHTRLGPSAPRLVLRAAKPDVLLAQALLHLPRHVVLLAGLRAASGGRKAVAAADWGQAAVHEAPAEGWHKRVVSKPGAAASSPSQTKPFPNKRRKQFNGPHPCRCTTHPSGPGAQAPRPWSAQQGRALVSGMWPHVAWLLGAPHVAA